MLFSKLTMYEKIDYLEKQKKIKRAQITGRGTNVPI